MLAIHTTVSASGIGSLPARPASANTRGVTRTAVVSRERKIVDTTDSSTTRIHSPGPLAARPLAAIAATRWKTPALAARLITAEMVARNSTIGPRRPTRSTI